MIGRLHIYAWDDAGRVYRHLGSLPGEGIPDQWLVAGNTIQLVPPLPPDPAPSDAPEVALPGWVDGRVTPLAGIGLALVVTPESVPNLPMLPGWTPRAKPKAAAEAPAA